MSKRTGIKEIVSGGVEAIEMVFVIKRDPVNSLRDKKMFLLKVVGKRETRTESNERVNSFGKIDKLS